MEDNRWKSNGSGPGAGGAGGIEGDGRGRSDACGQKKSDSGGIRQVGVWLLVTCIRCLYIKGLSTYDIRHTKYDIPLQKPFRWLNGVVQRVERTRSYV